MSTTHTTSNSSSSFGGTRLTADEARDLMNIKKENFDKSLSVVRQMCDVTLRDASRRGQCSMRFDIPISIWGRDSYDQHTMGRALASQIFDDGFDVTGTTSRLNISWGPSNDSKYGNIAENSCPACNVGSRLTMPYQNFRMTSPFSKVPSTFLNVPTPIPKNSRQKKVERKININV
jgi:hypothetical protein